MNNTKSGIASKKATKPVLPKVTSKTAVNTKPKDIKETKETKEIKAKDPPQQEDNQMSFSFNVSDIEKTFQVKLDAQKKTISKLKLEIQAAKEEIFQLRLTLDEKDRLLKEFQGKFTNDNEGFIAKRNFLLKSKVLRQEKQIVILESQIRNMKTLETEVYAQLENTIGVLGKLKGDDQIGLTKEGSRIDDTIEFLKICQTRLSEFRASGRYEFGLKIHKDGISTLEKEEREDDEGPKVMERSDLRSRLELEDTLAGILELLESLKDQLVGDKYCNTLVNLGHLTRKVAEFMIAEGLDVRKVKKVFGRKGHNEFIAKSLAYFEHLSQNLKENAEILRRFNQVTEQMAEEMVSQKSKKTVNGYIDEYFRGLNEDKREKLMKNKDISGLIESLREISKAEKYMHESQRAILSLFSAKAFGEIESLREFVEQKIRQVMSIVESDLHGPFKAMYTIYKNYENMGNEFTVGVNILSVFGMAGDAMMSALNKLLGLGEDLKKKNSMEDISLKMVINVFEKRVAKAMEDLGS